MYDDHFYCETCGKHSGQCWCHPMNDDDFADDPTTVCTIHDLHGEPLAEEE